MNFNLSEEQRMIQDSVARFVQDHYTFEQRNATVARPYGFSAEHWRQFAELGWLSVPFGEEYGGFCGGAVDTMVIMREFGRGLVTEPFLPTVLLFGGLLQAGASDEVKNLLIPRIIGGELQGAFAFLERQSRYVISDIRTHARQEGAHWVLNGEKSVVLNGGAARKLVVLARSSGEQFDERGLSLFLVDGSATGLSKTSYRMTDGRDAATIVLENVTAEGLIGSPGGGHELMKPVIDAAIMAVAADALGVMESLNARTLDYLKTRQQFGTHIGAFQALQHRMVDMFAACENTRSLLYRAVCALDGRDEDAQRSLLALKVMVGKAGRRIGGESIQMHGGMGMTEELPVGACVKRLMIANILFGDAEYQQQRFSALVNAPTATGAKQQAA